MTSMLKRVDNAVYEGVKEFQSKTLKSSSYGLDVDGVGYSTSGGAIDDIKAKLEDFKKKIISGEIKVTETV